MSDHLNQTCVIIGASHAGVNAAFALRKEGWSGPITLIDADPHLPYHRPPLSKAYLTSDDDINSHLLKPISSYQQNDIELKLGVAVEELDAKTNTLLLANGEQLTFGKLIIATGAHAFVPPIAGLADAKNVFTLRNAEDVNRIRETYRNLAEQQRQRVAVIGGGYIGLETAASLRKMGADVTVIERESRILARVTTAQMSKFFTDLHQQRGVDIATDKQVDAISVSDSGYVLRCADATEIQCDMVIIGVGVSVNTKLAAQAELMLENGIAVNAYGQTSNPAIYAIGDCSYHHNPHYDRKLRLESVQNAVDQAKVAAAHLCGKPQTYDAIPWFWSDQYDVKLQMVGLSDDHDEAITRQEIEPNKFSVWYFKQHELVAVDAVNQAKAYVLGTKLIKTRQAVNKAHVADTSIELKLANLID
ncbi:NAD(P)/FAD-dependent oxidoreductase [Neiella marina]|nr:FAD-dependent oxidoreductase [Neiella marina]